MCIESGWHGLYSVFIHAVWNGQVLTQGVAYAWEKKEAFILVLLIMVNRCGLTELEALPVFSFNILTSERKNPPDQEFLFVFCISFVCREASFVLFPRLILISFLRRCVLMCSLSVFSKSAMHFVIIMILMSILEIFYPSF